MSKDLTYDLVLRSRRTVLPDGEAPAAVAVRDGRIAAVAPLHARLDAAREEDLAGVALLPGLVDVHTHAFEPGRAADGAGFATATAAAAAGGVTTILDMPVASLPSTVSVEDLQAIRAAAEGSCAVDVGFWGGVVPGNLAELGPLYDAGVVGFKCFLAGRDAPAAADTAIGAGGAGATEDLVPLDNAGLRAAFNRLAELGPDTLMAVHAEDWSEIRHGMRPRLPHVPRLPATACRAARHREGRRCRGRHGSQGAHRAPVSGRVRRPDRRGEGSWHRADRRDLPALPVLRRGGRA